MVVQAQRAGATRSEARLGPNNLKDSAVSQTISGGFEVRAIKIDPACIDPKDPSMLQDLIIAAINQAIAKAQELQAGAMQSVTGGMNIPGLF